MNRWLLQSKLTPPSAPTGWLSRALLPVGTPLPPVTVLQAGPGYGTSSGYARAGYTSAWRPGMLRIR